MKRSLIIVSMLLGWALADGACSGGDGLPATNPINPFGTDSFTGGGSSTPAGTGATGATGGSGGTGGSGASIQQLCTNACNHIESLCPGSSGGANCVPQCTALEAYLPGCDPEIKSYVDCVSRAQIICSGTSSQISGCDAQIAAVQNCAAVAAPK